MNRRKFVITGANMSIGLLGVGILASAVTTAPAIAQPVQQRPNALANASEGGSMLRKSKVFITGSSDGLGYDTAKSLLSQGHDVVVHVRSQSRLPAVQGLLDQGAKATIADLSDPAQIRDLADQVNAIGRMDAVIHNAGVISGPSLLVVNVVAPYLLTALITRPDRLIYLSSSMHLGGSTNLIGIDWTGSKVTGSYSDSKLFLTTLSMTVARLWPNVRSNAVDPGWVPTKMGGPNAPDNLEMGHITQAWLATSNDPDALTSGGYWYHKVRRTPDRAVNDVHFQNALLDELARATGTKLA